MRGEINIIGISILITFLIIFFIIISYRKEYQVEITYCDDRPKKTITVTKVFVPSNKMIFTYREALPRYEGEVNVCEIKVIK